MKVMMVKWSDDGLMNDGQMMVRRRSDEGQMMDG